MTSFVPTVILYALALAIGLLVTAIRGKNRPAPLSAGLAILELVVLVVVLLDIVSVLRGDHGPDIATNVGYALAAVVLLPLSATAVRLDHGRWANVGFALGCAMVAVVVLRLHQTLGSPRG
jgi:K+ transporter